MRKNKRNIYKMSFFVLLVVLSFIYALPNFYGKTPSVVLIPKGDIEINLDIYESKAKELGVETNSEISEVDNSLSFRFDTIENQMNGYNTIKGHINDDDFYVNLTLLPTSPKWLENFGASGTPLGLDLMGGVHFLMEVDTDYAISSALKSYRKIMIRDFNLSIIGEIKDNGIVFSPYSSKLEDNIIKQYSEIFTVSNNNDKLIASLKPQYIKTTIDNAVKQNIFILKNRVNELGVAEPIIQREGNSRIVVQLPGIQDTQKARDLIGTTASLYFKKVKDDNILNEDSEVIKNEDGVSYVFFKDSIINGKSIIDASSGINPENNSAIVSVTLDSDGGNKMLEYTSKNIGSYMGSIIVETSYYTTKNEKGEEIKEKKITKNAINVARIQSTFSNRFQVTGLDNKDEAHKLAILLRAGSLAAPVDIIEERTIGPNMGAENIKNGKLSILIGFIMVLILMIVKYKSFGVVANFCVLVNLLMLLSLLSMIGSTLTLPGIAGILLTVGMAVDANVVIFERIKEEYKKKNNVKKSIKNGYDKALSSIVDANFTTFIAAFMLFMFGTGPVKGFAVTLSIGIITSLITSIYLSRFIVETYYNNKKELNI